ncbi:MAG: hypothetical protein D6731_19040 [Planctomycetota bacterium]|nr:MAG: hypothetical protein D6731_19040 [Planctomycetota bacterium]
MLDLIPPAVLLLLTLGLAGAVLTGGARVPRRSLCAALLAGTGLYALGSLLYLLGVEEPLPPGGRVGRPTGWVPGLALASAGTFLVPGAVVFALERSLRPRLLAVLVGLPAWLLMWVPPLRPFADWNFRLSELVATPYFALCATLVAFGVRRAAKDARALRVGFFFLPFVAVALIYLLLKSDTARGPVASTCVHIGSMVVLLVLLARKPDAERLPSPGYALLLQFLLLGVGAVLVLVLAANLRLFPKAPLPVFVAAAVATGLAVGYAFLRPSFDALVQRALSPEAARAQARLRALQRELEGTRARLQQAEQLSLVGQLAAQVAHEIKNPLGPIKGYTKIIEREALKAGALSEVVQRGIEIIRHEVEVIDERARSLLALARPPEPRLEEVDCVAMGQDVIDLARADAPAGVRVGWAADPAAPARAPVRADPVLLRGALLNVLGNALQALAERGAGGAVELSVRAGDGGWELLVEDDGPGLPAGDPEALFRPFVSHREGGSGLGLVVARGNLRAMGGDLVLEARPGGGARARLFLPGVEPGAPASSALGAAPVADAGEARAGEGAAEAARAGEADSAEEPAPNGRAGEAAPAEGTGAAGGREAIE